KKKASHRDQEKRDIFTRTLQSKYTFCYANYLLNITKKKEKIKVKFILIQLYRFLPCLVTWCSHPIPFKALEILTRLGLPIPRFIFPAENFKACKQHNCPFVSSS
ncbi:hypothetical protein PanWU01x14_331540, partial [Parasponia andersonii]